MSDLQQASPESVPPTIESMQSFFQLKQQMVAQFQQNYQAFMKSLQSFPIMQRYMGIAMDSFEVGFTMFQKGMELVPFQALTPVPASQPTTSESTEQESAQVDAPATEDCNTGSTEAA